MAMVFCRGCGQQIHDSAPSCPKCGAPQLVRPMVPPGAATAPQGAGLQALSDSWKSRFLLIEKAGGPKLPQSARLTGGERAKILFNVLAFLFGPIYYLIKGMWKKAITLTLIVIALAIVIGLIANIFKMPALGTVGNIVGGVVFAVRANIDYFKKICRNDGGWI